MRTLHHDDTDQLGHSMKAVLPSVLNIPVRVLLPSLERGFQSSYTHHSVKLYTFSHLCSYTKNFAVNAIPRSGLQQPRMVSEKSVTEEESHKPCSPQRRLWNCWRGQCNDCPWFCSGSGGSSPSAPYARLHLLPAYCPIYASRPARPVAPCITLQSTSCINLGTTVGVMLRHCKQELRSERFSG